MADVALSLGREIPSFDASLPQGQLVSIQPVLGIRFLDENKMYRQEWGKSWKMQSLGTQHFMYHSSP